MPEAVAMNASKQTEFESKTRSSSTAAKAYFNAGTRTASG